MQNMHTRRIEFEIDVGSLLHAPKFSTRYMLAFIDHQLIYTSRTSADITNPLRSINRLMIEYTMRRQVMNAFTTDN